MADLTAQPIRETGAKVSAWRRTTRAKAAQAKDAKEERIWAIDAVDIPQTGPPSPCRE